MKFGTDIDEYLSSTNVLIINGYSLNEPTIWILTTNGKSIELRTNQLESPAGFNDSYLQVFNTPAPFFKSLETWHEFSKSLASKAKVIDITEYIVHLETARQVIFYLYYSFSPEKESEDLDCLIKGSEGFVYVPIKTVKSFVNLLHFKTSMKVLARILEKMGIKEEPDVEEEMIKVAGCFVKVWKLNYNRMKEFLKNDHDSR